MYEPKNNFINTLTFTTLLDVSTQLWQVLWLKKENQNEHNNQKHKHNTQQKRLNTFTRQVGKMWTEHHNSCKRQRTWGVPANIGADDTLHLLLAPFIPTLLVAEIATVSDTQYMASGSEGVKVPLSN